ncbi:MAG: hypothetical protein ACXVEE_11610 [Polyangiales bacterium]
MRSSLLLVALLTACAAKGSGNSSDETVDDDSGVVEDSGGPEAIPTDGLEPTKGLAIKEVAVFQGPKVSLEVDGAKNNSRRAPVVAGRNGLVRVYVTPDGDWVPREVVATLHVGDKTFGDKKTIGAASTDAKLDSTFNFDLAGDIFAVGAQYSIDLKTAPGNPSAGSADKSSYPAGGGTESMDAKATGDALQIKIVPIQYNADGSGRLPDTSAGQLERYRNWFSKLYPAKKVEVTVRDAPMPWSQAIGRDGTGWNQILNAVVKLRISDGAGKGVYYYGAFEAADSFGGWCTSGCVAGLSPLATSAMDTWTAASVGIGWGGDEAAQTSVHEVGHGHGRRHAPCMVSDPDPGYPTGAGYSSAGLGPYGYDIEAKKLVAPSGAIHDMMSYCQPSWISDYTYGALATRMADVYAYEIKGASRNFRIIDVSPDGSLHGGDIVRTDEVPFGEVKDVVLELADGAKQKTSGAYYPYDHLEGGMLVVPVDELNVRVIRASGLTVPGTVGKLDVIAR